MSRREDLEKLLDSGNADGGMSIETWEMYLLTDIAVSLATIADELEEAKGCCVHLS